MDAVRQREGDDRLHDVQLKLPCFRRHRDGHVLADDVESHLRDHFGDDRVDLARHDRGTGLQPGQVDLIDARARAGGQQAQVIADLGQLDRDALEHAGGLHIGPGVPRRFDEVGGQHHRNAADFGEGLRGDFCVALGRVDACPNGGRAQIDLKQELAGFLDAQDVLADGRRVRAEFLTERHGHRVLQLCAAHLDDVRKLFGLGRESLLEIGHIAGQLAEHGIQGDAQGRGINVVGGLRAVHMVVGVAIFVFALLVAQQLKGAVGDDLVGVHVGRSSRAALNAVHGELIVQLALDDLVASRANGVPDLAGQHAELHVRNGRGLLDQTKRLDKFREAGDAHAGNQEVLDGPVGLDSIICIGRDAHFTQKIMFETRHGRFSCLVRILNVL